MLIGRRKIILFPVQARNILWWRNVKETGRNWSFIIVIVWPLGPVAI
jgi:hypothetical protein